MLNIYVLKRRSADFFGDGKDEWELFGWTDDPRIAGKWRKGATMVENREVDIVNKVTPNIAIQGSRSDPAGM